MEMGLGTLALGHHHHHLHHPCNYASLTHQIPLNGSSYDTRSPLGVSVIRKPAWRRLCGCHSAQIGLVMIKGSSEVTRDHYKVMKEMIH